MNPSPRPFRPILSAAAATFAQHGYAATSEEHLWEVTNLDSAAFRRRFADKEGCFLAAYDSLVATAHARLAAVLPVEAPWPVRLTAALQCLFELIDANPAAARLVFVESQVAGEAALKRYAATLNGVALFMRQGRERATAAEDPPPVLDAVLAGGVASSLYCRILRRAPVRDLYPEMLHLLLLPYLGETETAARLQLALRPDSQPRLNQRQDVDHL